MGHDGDPEAQVVSSTSRTWRDFMEEVNLSQGDMVFHVSISDLDSNPSFATRRTGEPKTSYLCSLSITVLTWKMGLCNKRERRVERGEK